MELPLVQKPKQVAPAGGCRSKPVRGIEPHISGHRFSAQRVAGQSVDLMMPRAVQAFLAADQHKPVVSFKALGPGLPDFPLPDLHRSDTCLTAAPAASSRSEEHTSELQSLRH